MAGITQYTGLRYVPIFADPAEWNNTRTYEPLTIVLNKGNSYTSRQFVPVGVELTNTDYWLKTGDYNAQLEQYRRDVQKFNSRITANELALNEITPFDTVPMKDSAKGIISGGVYNAIQNQLRINTSPSMGYEGIITDENANGYVCASSAVIAPNTIFQIFRDSSNKNGIYKIILVNNSNINRVIATGNIYNCGHANSCFFNDGKLYVITSENKYAIYNLESYNSELYPINVYTFDSLSAVGCIFYYDSKIYVATTTDDRQISIYLVSDNTTTTLIAKNILPLDTIFTVPLYPLRNDCTCDDFGNVFFALTNYQYNASYNVIFCYSLITNTYTIINLNPTVYAFNVGEIEGITQDPNTKAIYITAYTNFAKCVIAGINPYINMSTNGYIAKLPNTNQVLKNIRYGTCIENKSIYESGNTDSPITSLIRAGAIYNYYTNLLNSTDMSVIMLNDMTENIATLPKIAHFKLNLQQHTLTITGNEVQTGYGRIFINNGTLSIPNSLVCNIRGQLTLDNIDFDNSNFYFGACLAILRDVTNISYHLQTGADASLLHTLGTTPSYSA